MSGACKSGSKTPDQIPRDLVTRSRPRRPSGERPDRRRGSLWAHRKWCRSGDPKRAYGLIADNRAAWDWENRARAGQRPDLVEIWLRLIIL
jgi:hypothetical protein